MNAREDNRRKEDQLIRSAEKRLRVLMENVKDHAIFMVDPTGTLIDWNVGGEKILGYREEEIVGKNFSLFFTPEDVKARIPQQELEIARTKGRASDERWHIRKDRRLFWASGVVEPLYDEDGALFGFTKILRDFTEHRMFEEELERSNKDLEDFAHIVSHDLQSPLNKMVSFADLLRRHLGPKLDQKTIDYLERIQASAERMGRLIRSLLKFSKVTSSGKALEPVDMNDVIQDVLSELDLVVDQTGARIIVEDLPVVLARKVHMHQLMVNLIENAIKYRRAEPPVIHISANERNGNAVFQVQDNGIGIKIEEAKRIFDLFYRSGDAPQPGTGIGLAICKKIVERHGGRIWAEPNKGKGTTFFFTLRGDRRVEKRPVG